MKNHTRRAQLCHKTQEKCRSVRFFKAHQHAPAAFLAKTKMKDKRKKRKERGKAWAKKAPDGDFKVTYCSGNQTNPAGNKTTKQFSYH